MRNDSLWSNVVFEEEVISHSNLHDLIESRPQLRSWTPASESTQLVGCFFFHYSLATSTTNFQRFVISCICRDTPSEKIGLWQLPKLSSAFNNCFYYFFPRNFDNWFGLKALYMFGKMSKTSILTWFIPTYA